MWVTCYTDASYSEAAGGAWAVWLRSDLGRIVRAGRCPPYVRDSCAAELAAIFAGVHLALRAWAPHVRGIFVRSDSLTALANADPTAPLRRPAATRRLQDKLRKLLGEHAVVLSCRHARGHRPSNESTAAFLNGRCDALARATRRMSEPRRKRRKASGAAARDERGRR